MKLYARVSLGLVVMVVAAACSSGGSSNSSTGTTTTTAGSGPKTAGDPGNTSAGNAADAAYTPTGPLIADDGFRPDVNGLPFQNYGGQLIPTGETATELTADDMRRVFGDGVCVDLATGKCDLIPEAQAQMDNLNKGVQGGHCYGFSVASQLLWQKKLDSATFGAPTSQALTIPGNPTLQRELAVDWAAQLLDSVGSAKVIGTPNDIIAKLKTALVPNPAETYTVLIFKPDFSGGHAVTPYAIEDKGNGINNILIYDNNYPGVTREITVDTNANTWNYNAATNPNEPSELYTGDASTQTLFLKPTSPGIGVQPCPFCSKVPASSSGALGHPKVSLAGLKLDTTPPAMDEIYLDGSDANHGQLLITDDAGQQVGYLNGKFVNTIPGANIVQATSAKTWNEAAKPDYYVPDGHQYTITVDGTPLSDTDPTFVGVIGPSFDLSVDEIQLSPGEKDTLVFAPDATKLSYKASRAESPKLELAVSDTNADYTFDVSGVSDQPGSTVSLSLPAETTSLTLDTAGDTGTATFSLTMLREDDQGKTSFGHDGITLTAGDSAELQFGSWTNGQSIPLVTTHNGQQTTEQLTDQTP